MANRQTLNSRLGMDVLEPRLALSGLTSANVIGTSLGQVASPHEVSTTSAVVKTLMGDINGDGKVDLADVQAFAGTYMSRKGGPNYNPAADFNHNGVINLYDAKALLHNVAPISPRLPLNVELHLVPQDQIHYSGPTISGAATFRKVVTIIGRTTPGSLVIEDNHTSRLPGGTQAYKFTGPAHAADSRGFFSIVTTNTEGLNNNDFLILDPFGHPLIRDFPIFWIPYATGKGIPGRSSPKR
jgi:Dockerin type I domain